MTPGPASDPKSALFIQCARMGDLIQTLPLLRAVKRRHPHCSVSLVFDHRYEDLVKQFTEVDVRLPLDVREFLDSPVEQILNATRFREAVRWLRPLREVHYDLVCNLNFSASAAILASIAKARERRGFWYDPADRQIAHRGWFTYLLALTQHRRLNGFNLTELFMRGCGFAPEPQVLFPARVPHRETGCIGIQIGASTDRKRWPDSSFASLIRLLLEKSRDRVVLFGAPGERDAAQRICALVPSGARISLNFETPTHLLPHAFEEVDVLVTPDTGPMHVAAWSGVPTLALFTGSSYFVETAPWTENTVVLQASTPFNPCTDGGACCRAWTAGGARNATDGNGGRNEFSCHAALPPEWVFDILQRQRALTREGRDFSGLAVDCEAPLEAMVAVPTWKGGTLGFATGRAEQEILERDFYKAFWVSILGPEGTPLEHSIEGPRAGVEALQTAQLLFSSLSALETSGKPEERNARLRRNLSDLKSRFPELALMFDYYGMTPPPLKSGISNLRSQMGGGANASAEPPTSHV